jgi:hypothetical protein
MVAKVSHQNVRLQESSARLRGGLLGGNVGGGLKSKLKRNEKRGIA